jgi:hypothetical protein
MENGKEFKVEMPDGCSMTFVECEGENIPKDFDGGTTDGGKIRMDFSKIYPVNIEFPDGIEFDGDEGDIDYEEDDPIYEVPLATGEPFRVGNIIYRIVPGYGVYKKIGKYEYYVSLLGNLEGNTFYDSIPNIINFLRAKLCNVKPTEVYIDMGSPDNLSTIVKVYNIDYISYDSTIISPDLTLELDFMTSEFVMGEFEPMVYPCIEMVEY